ncbi:alanyl-tRNA editing protein Aarsd1-like [Palaemon carinicauda]|uniref:alanyl-tRNA editing protein Aarsd1-like n=1 Tax=Palaemon carinicauda TaxID=392227 RepID=UPI0035B5F15D
MVFQCQRDSYQKEFETTVVSCKPSKQEFVHDGKKKKVDCYEVTFEDTILFPEGGGQPDDRGTVNGIPVLRIIRRGGEAIHYLESSLEAGSKVTQKVDWQRRHDHMQQHSAQHLISAISEDEFGYATSSWYLGDTVSYIVFNTSTFTAEKVSALEDTINFKLRSAIPVTVMEYDAADPKLKESHTRGLPEDLVGPVRVVTMDGIDSNMCCGTHVQNLADIQAIKLLYTEKGKANKMLLYFVAGNRVLRYLGECVTRERELNTVLRTCPSDHVNRIEKLQKDLKSSLKSLRDAFKDLAVCEGQKFLSQNPRPKVYFHHRRDGDMDYLAVIINEINDESVLKILTAGEDKGPGTLVVHGPQDLVAQVGPKLCEILEGRGGGKTRFTGKVNRLGKREEAEKYVLSVLNYEVES